MTKPLPSLTTFPPLPPLKTFDPVPLTTFPPLPKSTFTTLPVLQRFQPHDLTQEEKIQIANKFLASSIERCWRERNITPDLLDRAKPLNVTMDNCATLICIGYCFFSIVAVASIVFRTELAIKYKVAITIVGGAAIPLLSIASPTLSGCAFMAVFVLGFLCGDPPPPYQNYPYWGYIDNASLPSSDPPTSQPNNDDVMPQVRERLRRWKEIYWGLLYRPLPPRLPVVPVPVHAAHPQDPRATAAG